MMRSHTPTWTGRPGSVTEPAVMPCQVSRSMAATAGGGGISSARAEAARRSRATARTVPSGCSGRPCTPHVVMSGSASSTRVPRPGSAMHAGQAWRRVRQFPSCAGIQGSQRWTSLRPASPGAEEDRLPASVVVEGVLPGGRVERPREPGHPPGDRRHPHHAEVGAGPDGQGPQDPGGRVEVQVGGARVAQQR